MAKSLEMFESPSQLTDGVVVDDGTKEVELLLWRLQRLQTTNISHVINVPTAVKQLRNSKSIDPHSVLKHVDRYPNSTTPAFRHYDCCQHHSHSFSTSSRVPGVFGSWVMTRLTRESLERCR